MAWLRDLLRRLYGCWALAAFVAVVLLLFCPLLIVAPTLTLRRAIGRVAVRAWLASIGVPLQVRGLDQLLEGPCVALCNHASYVDGIVFTAVLPARFTFLVQHDAARWPYVGLIIRRMGVTFVDRGSARRSARAVLGLIRRARAGGSLAIFPEGTFSAAPGLQAFKGGAFVVAAKASVPIVPAVMRGTRRLFAEGQKLPRWSPIEVEFLAPIQPRAASRADAAGLMAAARDVMRRHCGEQEPGRDQPATGELPEGAAT